ncbi:hypothetical protein [Arcanobacterium buesumense]|uniref:Phage head-tail adapter protein n=1 Tax=Arcanobacterium buesumense TaxID=2722751 RepID=A0A6H2ELQ9_9ACTO|nr:hypothetical protein [Arcanobacterium buesumense]QJC22010.1 hypothetical protein HC352_05505 [Arcanobacterium buesumense]
MIHGTQVTVLSKTKTGVDDMNMPVFEETQTVVDDVLVGPVSTDDTPGGMRRAGDRTEIALYFPKTFTASLRGCDVEFMGKIWRVQGDPQPYMVENMPTRWNLRATVSLVEG